jgi:hypothetical protein
MPYPQNPDTIIVQNKYYPNGLTQLDLWNYYQKNKFNIIKDLNNRTVFFEIATGVNETIIRRKGEGGKSFYINSSNFEDVMTGRTLVIYSQMEKTEKIGIIDIDIDNFDKAAFAAYEVYKFIQGGGIPFVKDYHIRYTGKTSFHIFCSWPRKKDIDDIRQLFRYYLSNSDLARKYTIESRRRPGIVNLDLSINKTAGGFISLHSLSRIGLPCVEVDIKRIFKFQPEQVKIRQ